MRIVSIFNNGLKRIRIFIINCLVGFISIIIGRDKKIWLFGSWMGQRFADNSRYLFQYLHLYGNKYGIHKVIWVSENDQLVEELRNMGYCAYNKYSRIGKYWHLKSGVHVVCNVPTKASGRNSDIIGEYSTCAIKIQLWHGVGIKAVGNLRAQIVSQNKSKKRRILSNDLLLGNKLFYPGCWSDRYQLTTSKENARVAIEDMGVRHNRIISANYPRLCEPIALLPEETSIIEDIMSRIANKKVILYCPTFREEKNSSYINPISTKEFLYFLKSNSIIWIEKRHFSSLYHTDELIDDSIYYLDPDFDINLLYRYVDLLITDYSSASSDCIYHGVKVLSFIPDIDEYEHNERGFVSTYSMYYPGEITQTIDQLMNGIQNALSDEYFTEDRIKQYNKCKEFLYENRPNKMEWIVEQILEKINYSQGGIS